MEAMTTPPTNQVKSASRLAQMASIDSETDHQEIPHFSVEYAPSPSPPMRRKTPASTPSKLSVSRPRGCLPIHELLLNLSPSPVRKSRTRLSDRLEMGDDQGEHRRRCKTRTSANGLLAGCGSPRNVRRSRRRIEQDEREFVAVEELVKPRKRRQSGKSKKEKATSANSALQSKENGGEGSALDQLGMMIWDLIIWRDVAKSSLWFGFGCLCFLSSCFTKGLNISLLSVISQLGLLFLAASFTSNTLYHREDIPRTREMRLKEDDILRVIRVVLPALNLAILKTRQLFSGEPSMTLKVAVFLLVGAEYGHLLTIWRLCALGFFISFSAPKLYSSYAAQIDTKVEQYKSRVMEAWKACYHKKIVAASAATIFWNLSCLKTRVFAAFISLVILRYYRQNTDNKVDEKEEIINREENVGTQGQAEVQEEPVEVPQQALVVTDEKSDK